MALGDTLEKSEINSQGRPIFKRLQCFWDEKLTKPGQIQSCKFSLSLFDQVSFDQVSFDQLSFDQLSFDQLSAHDNQGAKQAHILVVDPEVKKH